MDEPPRSMTRGGLSGLGIAVTSLSQVGAQTDGKSRSSDSALTALQPGKHVGARVPDVGARQLEERGSGITAEVPHLREPLAVESEGLADLVDGEQIVHFVSSRLGYTVIMVGYSSDSAS